MSPQSERPTGEVGCGTLIVRWLIAAVALYVTALLLPGLAVPDFTAALIAAAVIGLLNALVRPLLIALTLPITMATLGLFLLVINALMLLLADWLLGASFEVNGLLWALLGAVVLAIVITIVDAFVQGLVSGAR